MRPRGSTASRSSLQRWESESDKEGACPGLVYSSEPSNDDEGCPELVESSEPSSDEEGYEWGSGPDKVFAYVVVML